MTKRVKMTFLFIWQLNRIGDLAISMRAVELVRLQHPSSKIYVQCQYPELIQCHPAIDGAFDFSITTIIADIIIDQHFSCSKYEVKQNPNIRKSRHELFCEHANEILEKAGLHGIKWDGRPQTLWVSSTLYAWAANVLHHVDSATKKVAVFGRSKETWRTWPHIDKLLRRLRTDNNLAIFYFDDEQSRELSNITQFIGYTLDKVLALLSHMNLVISPDSAGIHLAGGLGIPLLGIFGATDPLLLLSAYQNAHWQPIQCPYHPCWYNKCEKLTCLKHIKPRHIHHLITKILREESQTRFQSAGVAVSNFPKADIGRCSGIELPCDALSSIDIATSKQAGLSPQMTINADNVNISLSTKTTGVPYVKNDVMPKYQQAAMISSWDVACGIAEYTKELIKWMDKIEVVPLIHIGSFDIDAYDVIHLQYEPSFFKDAQMGLWELIRRWKNAKKKVVITAHFYDTWLQEVLAGLCDRVIVHDGRFSDIQNHDYIIQGCPVFDEVKNIKELRREFQLPLDKKILTGFGFIMGWKQLDYVYEHLLPHVKKHNIFVQILHSHHSMDTAEGERVSKVIKKLRKKYRLQNDTYISHKFLSKEEINHRLQVSDLGFLWKGLAESKGSSAVTKEYIAGRCPLVACQISHYSDLFRGIKFVSPSVEIDEFCATVITAINSKELIKLKEGQRLNYEQLNYQIIGQWHMQLYNEL